ncbi:MAG TPA: PhzF family phenazine biosynthesis protein [Sphingomonas sp.]|uniref:PhzF family phenazine biosynthesis protein n=1 Tax=Sphingomonas sp. TaxID=28214 RepID=UPI002C9F3C13|nr:PhzF family phenazine biosynthesis protein [Sphingomonas sp.]HMI19092.1 PhzF family phenazine biosynthesis protein [Sphingomonas sp.]
MSDLPFWHIDAFADGPFTGNPAGVLRLDRWRDAETLQAIAREINLPATAFAVAMDGEADFEIRWFSPRGEIGLCGHGTLAAGHALIGDGTAVCFATRTAGLVRVERDGATLSLSLPVIRVVPQPLPDAVAAIGGAPVETLRHDRGYGILRYADEAAVRALAPDFAALAGMGDVQFSATAPGSDSDIVSRVFTSRGGEDAVTGSAHSVLTPYWAAQLGRESFTAFQASARGGRLDCRLEGERAVLSGKCVTVIEGRFRA